MPSALDLVKPSAPPEREKQVDDVNGREHVFVCPVVVSPAGASEVKCMTPIYVKSNVAVHMRLAHGIGTAANSGGR